jgi:hypothetical protein
MSSSTNPIDELTEKFEKKKGIKKSKTTQKAKK